MWPQPHQPRRVTRKPSLSSVFTNRIGLLAFLICVAISSASAQYVVRKTQVDISKFPVIRVFVSITDAAGNPIPDDRKVDIVLREDGREVAKDSVSQGHEVSSVLVLDVSQSMAGEKLASAQEAAINYVNQAQPNHQIAVVTFSSGAAVWTDFTADKDRLRSRIQQLSVKGSTSLQEGIATALNLLRNRTGRKAMLVLTDGYENQKSGPYAGEGGHQLVIQRARQEECSISTVGLGSPDSVDESYLKSYEETQGRYAYAPSPAELSSIFGQSVKLLQKERVFTYTTSNRDPDGTRRSITAELCVNKSCASDAPTLVTIPGLLPHVAGNHSFYFALLLVLLILPGSLPFFRSFLAVYSFRRTHLIRLKQGSAYIGRHDLNDGPDQGFLEGDLLIVCPASETPHHVQCWRYNKCHCFLDNSPGHFCYHRKFPKWLRQLLDFLFAGRSTETGRTWLCRCAGDQEGC